MLDLQAIRKNPEDFTRALAKRPGSIDLKSLLELDKEHRQLIVELENLNQVKNQANLEVVTLKKNNQDTTAKIAEMKEVSQKISDFKAKVEDISHKISQKLLFIPNTPSQDTPEGKDSSQNKLVRSWGEVRKPDFEPKTHMQLIAELDLVDLERAAKLSGSSFLLFKGKGAKLERALIQFMLDLHTREHGYDEISAPLLVRRKSMQGTGQLPKFEEDMYRIYRGSAEDEDGKPRQDDMFLIPTAEVPITNIFQEEIIDEAKLPISYTGYTPCFRLEAGAYGKDTKGMIRVHQFDKVELVKFVRPEEAIEQHELLVTHAEKVLQLLEIPYRIMQLCGGDLGFSASKCYDIEVWAPGMKQWLEASSCSHFGDFQARRADIKYREAATKKTRFVHTINGSGVALARTFIALIENQQQRDGSIRIPKALQSYYGGDKL